MKGKLLYKLAYISVFGLITSCSKYLDEVPDMRTEINTIDKVGQLLVTAYPEYEYLLFTELASDNSFDKGPAVGTQNDIARDSYFWNEVLQNSGSNAPTIYWNAAYKAIAAANQALQSIEENDFGAKGQQHKGEALLARAYSHFMLVNIFAKAYVIGGENNTPGIPYVEEVENKIFKEYTRGTVASVYKNIERDLDEGLRLLQGVTYKVPKFHFNQEAANAFACRFYLFKGDYGKVIEYANKVLPSTNVTSVLRPVASTLRTIAFADASAEFANSERPYNLLLANVFSSFASIIGNGRYGFGNRGRDIVNATNVTGTGFYNRFGSYGDDKLTVSKYPGFFYVTNPLSNIGYNYTVICLFSTDEVLMNRAEAYVHLGQHAEALKDLNSFAQVRIQTYTNSHVLSESKIKTFYKTEDFKEGLIKNVLDFRRIGFLHEGLRWFDINRYGIEIEHNHIDANGFETTQVLTKDDLRRVFQLPETVNTSNVEKNPR